MSKYTQASYCSWYRADMHLSIQHLVYPMTLNVSPYIWTLDTWYYGLQTSFKGSHMYKTPKLTCTYNQC